MDRSKSKVTKKYDRVMSRVYNSSRTSLDSRSLVTRHHKTSPKVGAKPSISNISSTCVFSDLPAVLHDYKPEEHLRIPVKRSLVVKPRRTIKSLDPSLSAHRTHSKPEKTRLNDMRAQSSAPTVRRQGAENWSEAHMRQCNSSRSHCKLNELKEEINSFRETEKLLNLRAKLFRSCGVVLDDDGEPCKDSAVQVDYTADDDVPGDIREERPSARPDAGAALLDQQMSLASHRYPVDRYLVESSKNFEIVNIIDDDLWNAEPALRPEDEIILRKLQDMLQSTAEDLRVLSGELTKCHESSIQVKMLPTPLDEDFNDKVHIEEIVNAKFHGKKIINNPILNAARNDNKKVDNKTFQKICIDKPVVTNTSVQVNTMSLLEKTINRSLGVTKPKTIEIKDQKLKNITREKTNVSKTVQSVLYNEFSHEYEPQHGTLSIKPLRVQHMPSVNIRSELKEQKVLLLDIKPEKINTNKSFNNNSNIAVFEINHDIFNEPIAQSVPKAHETNYHQQTHISDNRTVRKISMMSTCESSESTNNVSSDLHRRLKTQKQLKSSIRISPKTVARSSARKSPSKNETNSKISCSNLDIWKRKLNSVYGKPSKKIEDPSKSNLRKSLTNKPNQGTKIKTQKRIFNNAEYIPYSKFTLGGVRVSDIEREISDGPIKNDVPLSPILDQIITSRENSFHDSPRKTKKNCSKVLTTSDENLLREVIDLENQVSKTLSKSEKNNFCEVFVKSNTKESDSSKNTSKDNDSYDDDFEASDNSEHSNSNASKKISKIAGENNYREVMSQDENNTGSDSNNKDTTYIKTSNLSFKNTVEVYEFVHSVNTQDSATQSNTVQTLNLKETQTSPRNETPHLESIHNDLWPSIDPKSDVENMFELEKEFIKKLIIEEYGEIIEERLDKPSNSKQCNQQESRSKNVVATQKNTQTSPAHVKSVMTSPTRTKTRTTSPFISSLTVDHQTSPLIFLNNQEIPNQTDVERSEPEDLGISINLSSPRFSLRLPQTSREVLTNLEHYSQRLSVSESKKEPKNQKITKSKRPIKPVSSSSSLDASSSEISSLGEVTFKLKRRLRRNRISTISETSSTSTISKSSSDFQHGNILPLRSEGEISIGTIKIKHPKNQSDKDHSRGQL